MKLETLNPTASTGAWELPACAPPLIDCTFPPVGTSPADARVTQRVAPPGAGERVYFLDLRIDPVSRAVLSYRLRLAPHGASTELRPG
jgi:hypothetical protein